MKTFFYRILGYRKSFYFDELIRLSALLDDSAEQLRLMVNNANPDTRMDYYRRIKEIERRGDQIAYSIFDRLGRHFMTPLRREDIHLLAQKIDNIIDEINSSAKRIAIYNPEKILTDVVELTRIIRQDARTVNKATRYLCHIAGHSENIRAASTLLHKLEHRADDVYEAAIMKLFEGTESSREIIKNKEILSELEHVTDAADYFGKTLQTMVVKYG